MSGQSFRQSGRVGATGLSNAPSNGRAKVRHTSLSESVIGGIAAALDVFIISATGLLLFTLMPGRAGADISGYLVVIAIYTVFVVQTFSISRLYRFGAIIHPVRQMQKSLVICFAAFAFLLFIGFSLKVSADYSRAWTMTWFISTTLLIQFTRFGIWAFVRDRASSGRLSRNVVIYGAGEHGQRLVEYLDNLDHPWNRIVGVFDQRKTRISDSLNNYAIDGGVDELIEYCRTNPVDEILISLPGNCESRIREIVDALVSLPVNVRLCPEFIGTDFMNRPVCNHFGIPMLNIMEKPLSGWRYFSKRMFDLSLSAVLTLISLPLIALIAIAIKLDSPGPVLFRQKRYGFNNQLIEVFKFRTMYADKADADAELQTQRNDMRVTRLGAFLRRFSLDELPQLFNVLRGEMSVVGPRPHATQTKAAGKLFEDVVDNYAVRHKVKPGITGWAQVRGWRGGTDTEDAIVQRVEHDLYYIEHWSLFFDIYILLKTFRAVIVGENSY